MTRGFEYVETTLDHYSELTRGAMDAFLIDGQPAGQLYDLVREYPGRRGKGIRPSLLLAACQAHGGTAREGLGPAVALEMMHNAFLIHDDLEDASATRRGEPTLHELHGVGLAVNAGDALASMALQPLRDNGLLGTRVAELVLDEFLTMVRVTTEGQAMELGWRRNNAIDLEPADYVEPHRQEDVLVHDGLPPAGGRARRLAGHGCAAVRLIRSASSSGPRSRSGTTC